MLKNTFQKLRHFNVNQKLVRFLSAKPETEPKCPVEHQVRDNNPVGWENALPYSKIPGPKKLPVIGAGYCFMPGGKYFGLSMIEIHKKMREEYGDIVALRGLLDKPDVVLCLDPNDMEMVYRTEGQWPQRRSFETFIYFRKNFRPDIFKETGGLLAEHGESWYDMRSKVNSVMLQPKTVRLYVKPVDDVAKDFIERIKSLRDKNNEVPANFGNEMNKWSLESIGCIALDARLGVLGDLGKGSNAQKFIEAVHNFFVLSYELDVLPSIWKYYKSPKFVKMMVTLDALTNLTMNYIDEGIKRFEKSNTHDDSRELSVLEKLLKIDRNTAIVMALDMLMAGVDTTSAATLSFLYFMAKNPDKQDILRQEILEKLPNKDSELNSEDMKNMPYMRACFKESHRIMPVVFGILRTIPQNIVLRGFQIHKGTDIAMGNMLIQNDEKYYMKSQEFLPERWLKNIESDVVESSRNTHPFVYMPFGFGPRSCIGRRFAELEQEILILRILRNFKVEWHHPPMTYERKLLNSPGGDLKFRFVDFN